MSQRLPCFFCFLGFILGIVEGNRLFEIRDRLRFVLERDVGDASGEIVDGIVWVQGNRLGKIADRLLKLTELKIRKTSGRVHQI